MDTHPKWGHISGLPCAQKNQAQRTTSCRAMGMWCSPTGRANLVQEPRTGASGGCCAVGGAARRGLQGRPGEKGWCSVVWCAVCCTGVHVTEANCNTMEIMKKAHKNIEKLTSLPFSWHEESHHSCGKKKKKDIEEKIARASLTYCHGLFLDIFLWNPINQYIKRPSRPLKMVKLHAMLIYWRTASKMDEKRRSRGESRIYKISQRYTFHLKRVVLEYADWNAHNWDNWIGGQLAMWTEVRCP